MRMKYPKIHLISVGKRVRASECWCRFFLGASCRMVAAMCAVLCTSRRLWKISSRRSFPNSLFLSRRFIFFLTTTQTHALAQHNTQNCSACFILSICLVCVVHPTMPPRNIYLWFVWFNTQRSKCNTDPCFPFFFTIDYTPVSVCLFRFFFFPCTNKRSRAHPHLAIFSILWCYLLLCFGMLTKMKMRKCENENCYGLVNLSLKLT